jgi:hypothetical protein
VTGKEYFKAVKKDYIESILTNYNVSKDKAYSMLANVLNEPKVEKVIFDTLEEKFATLKDKSPFEVILDDFFKIR